MEYVYGAMLLHSAGQEVNENNMEKVLTAGGVKSDAARIKAVVASLDGVDIDDAIKTAALAATPAAPVAAPEPAAGAEPKKDKEEEGKTEEEAASGLASLFG